MHIVTTYGHIGATERIGCELLDDVLDHLQDPALARTRKRIPLRDGVSKARPEVGSI